MPFKTRLLAAAAAAATTFTFGAAAFAAGEVNVYSGRHYDSDVAVYDSFTAATGIQVNIIEARADELIERIQSEGAGSPADLLITVDAGRLWRADQAGLFQPVDSDVLEENLPESVRHPDGHWFGLTLRARGIVTAKDRVAADAIDTYDDLTDAEWNDRICIRSSNNIYNQSLIGSFIVAEGEEAAEAWSRGIFNNLARDPQGGDTDQIRAVAAGECDVAVVNHYYLARLMASGNADDRAVADKVRFVFPNQDGRGTHTNISGAGVIATAPNRDNAIKLLQFLSSPAAQALFAASNNEFPANDSVAPTPILESFGEFKSDAMNAEAFGEKNPAALQVVDRVGWP